MFEFNTKLDNGQIIKNQFMIKFLLISILVISTLGFNKECFSELSETLSFIKKLSSQELTNDKIDSIANRINKFSDTVGKCAGKDAKDFYTSSIPPACVADLDKAAKIALRMQNQKDNQILYAKDLILLQRLFQTKAKKSCPFLTNVTLQDIKDKATCMQASYRFSLLIQKFVGDLDKGDKKVVQSDINVIVTQLPSVLDTCGQHQWAEDVQKYVPLDCIHSIEEFLGELGRFEHNYTHLEWVIKNYKGLQVYAGLVRARCPFFK